ncbi:hypothetical protein [Streptomyces chromofuscus]|nr:hypothetical protein [Streptomyces chromofuscus]
MTGGTHSNDARAAVGGRRLMQTDGESEETLYAVLRWTVLRQDSTA